MRKKLFNEHAFDKIDFLGAYFLGILFSDGCVCSTTKGRFVTCLSMIDKDVIKRFKKFLQAKNKIRFDNKGRYTISVCSKYLFKILNKYGCVVRKSSVIGAPKISKKYYFSFILGVIDGDGGISLNRSINSWKMSIGTGSFKFFIWLKSVFDKTLIKYSVEYRRKNKNRKKFYTITFIGFSARTIMELLHKNSNIALMNRKLKLLKHLNKGNFRKGPNLFPWEMALLRKNISNENCSILISKDKRNYGWTRSPDSIRLLRKYHNIEAHE